MRECERCVRVWLRECVERVCYERGDDHSQSIRARGMRAWGGGEIMI